MKVAVTGAGGQLGQDLVRHLPSLGNFEVVPLARERLDITDVAEVEGVVGSGGFDVIINCAAMTNVDRCEEEAGAALEINATGVHNLARACARFDCHLVQISTDFVFDGESAEPYSEDDCPAPVSVYGASKLSGEQLAVIAHPRTLVARISSVFGRAGSRGKGGNFVETILSKARNREPLSVVNDLVMSPTYTVDVVHALARLLPDRPTGTLHLANAGACTWFDFARAALELSGIDAKITAVSSSAFPRPARRPRNSSLSGHRVRKLMGEPMRPWRDALAAYLEETE